MSDPYLFTGYDRKHLTLSADKPARIRVEADITGTGLWVEYKTFEVQPGKPVEHEFPSAYGAYWLRCVSDAEITATAQLKYD